AITSGPGTTWVPATISELEVLTQEIAASSARFTPPTRGFLICAKEEASEMPDTSLGSEKTVKVALTASAGDGGVLNWQNIEADVILITRLVVEITSVATTGCTCIFGSAIADATTTHPPSGNELILTLPMDKLGIFDNIRQANRAPKA